MNLIKEKILQHIETIGELHVLQSGFTKGRRLEDNLFILNYYIEKKQTEKERTNNNSHRFRKSF